MFSGFSCHNFHKKCEKYLKMPEAKIRVFSGDLQIPPFVPPPFAILGNRVTFGWGRVEGRKLAVKQGEKGSWINLAHRNRSDFCDLRLRCPSRTPEIAAISETRESNAALRFKGAMESR